MPFYVMSHWLLLQLIFSTLVLLLSLIVTVVSVVVWQRKARHTSHARYASLASNASSQSSERGVSINSAEAKPSDSSPSTEQKNYHSCGTALNCASKWRTFRVGNFKLKHWETLKHHSHQQLSLCTRVVYVDVIIDI